MITRETGYLTLSDKPVAAATEQLQSEGYAVLRSVFSAAEVEELGADIGRVFDEYPPDERNPGRDDSVREPFRYELLNRSEVAQRAIASPAILEVIEPVLGEDCHVIANTAWRQRPEPSSHGGRFWHIDAGPHVPRPAGVPWDPRIPYPIFAVAAHIFIEGCPIESGPTGVIPGSHTSGQPPPRERASDDDLTWEGRPVVPLLADSGDVALFVSDVWHRRLPSREGDPGRFFLQCHYARRDLAQRLKPTSEVNHLTPESIKWADSGRRKRLVGLHRPGFYDG